MVPSLRPQEALIALSKSGEKNLGAFLSSSGFKEMSSGWEGTADMKGSRKHLIETPLAGGRDITP